MVTNLGFSITNKLTKIQINKNSKVIKRNNLRNNIERKEKHKIVFSNEIENKFEFKS